MKGKFEKLNICFILTHIPNPRMNKRIAVFRNFAETTVICTRRASQNIWEPSQDVEHIIYDTDLPSGKHIIKRYVISQSFQKKALGEIKKRNPNVIYAEGLDSLMIAEKFKRTHKAKIIYEVADLRENYIVKPKNPIARVLTEAVLIREKKLFKQVDYLVVTSPKFYDLHYNKLISREKMLFIPNAPDLDIFNSYKKKKSGDFTIGFIGGIRYLNQMKMLVDASEEVGVNVLFAGAGGTVQEYSEIQHYCTGKNNVAFFGRYDYKKDIVALYEKVDCVFAVYNADNPNVKIALPNKLYESILCELPIIVAKDTYLAEIVTEWNVGVVVSHKDLEELKNALNRLKNDTKYYQKICSNCKKMKQQMLDQEWKDQVKRMI